MVGAPVLGRMARRVASMQDLSSSKFTVPLETREMRKAKVAHSSFIHFLSSKPIAAALKETILG